MEPVFCRAVEAPLVDIGKVFGIEPVRVNVRKYIMACLYEIDQLSGHFVEIGQTLWSSFRFFL
jgi:hypothetical protein